MLQIGNNQSTKQMVSDNEILLYQKDVQGVVEQNPSGEACCHTNSLLDCYPSEGTHFIFQPRETFRQSIQFAEGDEVEMNKLLYVHKRQRTLMDDICLLSRETSERFSQMRLERTSRMDEDGIKSLFHPPAFFHLVPPDTGEI